MQDQVLFLAASSLYPRKFTLGIEYVLPFIDYFTQALNTARDIARAEIAFVLDKTRFYDHYGEKFLILSDMLLDKHH